MTHIFKKAVVWALAIILCASLKSGAFFVSRPLMSAGTLTCRSSSYALTGTVGQIATPKSYGINYRLDGGCHSIIAALQEPGAPPLSVRLTEWGSVILSWPLGWPGFELVEASDVQATEWTPVAAPKTSVRTGDNQFEVRVEVAMPVGNRFYRLRKVGP